MAANLSALTNQMAALRHGTLGVQVEVTPSCNPNNLTIPQPFLLNDTQLNSISYGTVTPLNATELEIVDIFMPANCMSN